MLSYELNSKGYLSLPALMTPPWPLGLINADSEYTGGVAREKITKERSRSEDHWQY